MATPALAQAAANEALQLTWRAPPGCPATNDVRKAALAENTADTPTNARELPELLKADASVRVRHSAATVVGRAHADFVTESVEAVHSPL